MGRIAPQPGIMEIALYQGGASTLPGRSDVLKLSSNENPRGAPPSAMAAVTEAAARLHRYPPTDHADLRAAIGEAHGLDPERIICGAGSDEVFVFLVQSYAGPGDEILHTEHGFSLYPILAHSVGATPVSVPERDRVVDVDALLAGVTERTRIVFLTNPGNPTATRLPDAEVARLAEGLPESCLLILDGAYAEYAEGYDGGAALAESRPNVVMTRTFSKIYGLGGLRIGWGYGAPEVIDVLNRVRAPFNLSGVQLAAAEAAVRDRDWVAAERAANARNRARLAGALAQLGLPSDPSETNFILPRFADAAEAEACEAHLRGAGILVRKVAGYGLPQCLRITVGTDADCDRVIAAIRDWREGTA
ncbi:histidinol-phosphate transaminase [Histidinibacterium aquaticum]|uniref:Histidinol-phosphate aminotransferase n=1 Tax=Histidinibacterium aquaticum TaxID=2613962 RepID=A0A5J5GJ65_9RHOB|nr:histidinol-phosphate transaminase [Histidinibacterium aquaticum]KAA9008281.1 histidinol-phosphate transaminase [Histidinibacterium aquaticum]